MPRDLNFEEQRKILEKVREAAKKEAEERRKHHHPVMPRPGDIYIHNLLDRKRKQNLAGGDFISDLPLYMLAGIGRLPALGILGATYYGLYKGLKKLKGKGCIKYAGKKITKRRNKRK